MEECRIRRGELIEEERDAIRKETEEQNREIREKIEKERLEGVDVGEKYACGRPRSNHDLRPKEGTAFSRE
jgi:hypothetical protein